jgi:hypothetical protein
MRPSSCRVSDVLNTLLEFEPRSRTSSVCEHGGGSRQDDHGREKHEQCGKRLRPKNFDAGEPCQENAALLRLTCEAAVLGEHHTASASGPGSIIHARPLPFSGPDHSRVRSETWITLGLMRDVDGRSATDNAAAHVHACEFPMARGESPLTPGHENVAGLNSCPRPSQLTRLVFKSTFQ